MGKYDRLGKFLSLHRDDKITLTLEQTEMLLGSRLPESARVYSAWWSDASSHPQVRSWSDIGWKVHVHSEKGKVAWVTFRKREE